MANKSQQQNLFSNNTLFQDNAAASFFATNNPIEDEKFDKQKWLNDVDSDLILENIDNTAQNKVVKINLKLKALERTLLRLDEELKILQLFNLEKDKDKRAELYCLKENLIQQISNLKEEKKKFGFFYILAAYTNDRITYENIKCIYDRVKKFSIKYINLGLEYLKSRDEFKSLFKR